MSIIELYAGDDKMTVRTLTLTKSKLTDTGLALLDWGFWGGKPEEFGEQITVPVWRDLHYHYSVFQITIYPPDRISDNETWSIPPQYLKSLGDLDVNDWWNRLAENIMDRIDRENLLIAFPEDISQLTTQTLSRNIPTSKLIHRQS